MGLFVSPREKVDVPEFDDQDPTDEKGNVMVIRARMDYVTHAKVQDELLQIRLSGLSFGQQPNGDGPAEDEDGEDEGSGAAVDGQVSIPQYNLALLKHNIVAWRGPEFLKEKRSKKGKVMTDKDGNPIMVKVPCRPSVIGTFDPNEPFVNKVLQAILARNKQRTEDAEDAEDAEQDPKEPAISVSSAISGNES